MPASTIFVSSGGAPYRGARVCLSFALGGVTSTVSTGSDGKATITHDGTGTAKIIVDGVTKGTMRAPGTASVSR